MGNIISLDELSNFKGDVCLYSLKFEDNLGNNIKNKFNKLFINNSFSYNNSLAFRTSCSLILIDGDDFSPAKISGLIKSYDVPVVVFVGNEQKKSKLLETLLAEPVIIDKNTAEKIECSEAVEKNLEEKKKKDLERENSKEKINKIDLKDNNVVSNTEMQIKQIPKSEDFFFSSGMLDSIGEEKEEAKEKNIDDILIAKNNDKDLSLKDDFNKGLSFENKIEKENLNISEKDISLPTTLNFLETDELEKSFDFAKEKRLIQEKKKQAIINNSEENFYVGDKKLSKIGCYTNDLSVNEVMKQVFKDFETIDVLNNKVKYDIVIVDITFTLVDRVVNFLDYQNCPTIIITKSLNSKKEEFLEKNYMNIYMLEKPLSVSPDIIKNDFKKYLNSFDYNKNIAKKNINNPEYIKANNSLKGVEQSKDGIIEKRPKMYKKPTVSDVKKEINSINKRPDKVESLESIYKRIGLDDIVAFNSNINKSIFICNDNKVIKYTPAGYLIEYRIRRLENQGMSKSQINNVLKSLEDSDIKYQKRILQEIEDKRYSK